ncbi:MAG: HAMP domain-containing sensor histidine kinase [Synergistota bacterium]|nr:HAMP domain-containing sensor histidine kinase [Synergistota bacterium]
MKSSRMELWIKSVIIPLALILTLGITGASLFVEYREKVQEVGNSLSAMRTRLSGASEEDVLEALKGLPVIHAGVDGTGNETRGLTPDRGKIVQEVLYSQRHVIVVGMIGMLFALELSIFMAHVLTRPVKRLVWGCERVSEGDWVHFPEHAAQSSEMGALYESFNAMVDRLREWRKVEDEASRIQRMAAFGQMMAGISHEIKNPLASMRIHLDLIREHIRGEGAEDWGIISGELDRLNAIMSEMLNFARPHPPMPEEVRFDYLEGWCRRMVGAQLSRQSVEWKVAAPEGDNIIWGDLAQLQQMMLNLVMNALQVQPGGGFIELGYARVEGGAKLCVRDGGPGVPEQVASSLFDPFVTTRPDGTGLGLTVVLKVVNLHGGRIEVNSDGEGAEFSVVIPFGKGGSEDETLGG